MGPLAASGIGAAPGPGAARRARFRLHARDRPAQRATCLIRDPGKIDGLILSSAPTATISAASRDFVIGQHRSRMQRRPLRFYTGGEDGFREKFLGGPQGSRFVGLMSTAGTLFAEPALHTRCAASEPHDLSHAFTYRAISSATTFEEVSGRLDGLRVRPFHRGPSGGASSSRTRTRTSMPLATSCRVAGWSSSARAGTSG